MSRVTRSITGWTRRAVANARAAEDGALTARYREEQAKRRATAEAERTRLHRCGGCGKELRSSGYCSDCAPVKLRFARPGDPPRHVRRRAMGASRNKAGR